MDLPLWFLVSKEMLGFQVARHIRFMEVGWGTLWILHCLRSAWNTSSDLHLLSILCCKKSHAKAASSSQSICSIAQLQELRWIKCVERELLEISCQQKWFLHKNWSLTWCCNGRPPGADSTRWMEQYHHFSQTANQVHTIFMSYIIIYPCLSMFTHVYPYLSWGIVRMSWVAQCLQFGPTVSVQFLLYNGVSSLVARFQA